MNCRCLRAVLCGRRRRFGWPPAARNKRTRRPKTRRRHRKLVSPCNIPRWARAARANLPGDESSAPAIAALSVHLGWRDLSEKPASLAILRGFSLRAENRESESPRPPCVFARRSAVFIQSRFRRDISRATRVQRLSWVPDQFDEARRFFPPFRGLRNQTWIGAWRDR